VYPSTSNTTGLPAPLLYAPKALLPDTLQVLFGEPVPAEYEWARAQCREALPLVLQGLDA
jgi:hypothetical protein